MSEKKILEQWRDVAYDESADKGKLQKFWATYFNIERSEEHTSELQSH